MIKLGITGGIGAGKSTAATYLTNKGAKVFNADKEAKNLILSQKSIQKNIIDAFGDLVTNNNSIDLKKLSSYAFSSKKNQNILNQIVWPEVYNLMISKYKQLKNNTHKCFVVDAALLIEANYTDFFNSIILITANKNLRVKRIKLKNIIPDDQIEKRMKLQMSESEKQKYAHYIIKNNGNLEELHLKLEQVWKKLY